MTVVQLKKKLGSFSWAKKQSYFYLKISYANLSPVSLKERKETMNTGG